VTVHVVSVGGGLASTMVLPERVVARYGREHTVLVMAKLPNEDPDVWRLCDAVEAHLGLPIQYIGLGMTPWDIFFKERMMGSSRIDPCSRLLKRQVLDRWVKETYPNADVTCHVGITYHEVDRFIRFKAAFARQNMKAEALLADDPTLTREWLMAECERRYGFIPRLYRLGFSHNNCGGACVKAGHKEWARLLFHLPDVYAWWEENEQRFQEEIGTTATILRDRRGGSQTWLSLRAFRERMEVRWAGMLPGVDPFEGLDETPACMFCTVAA
jgi:hypothetical protein